MPGEPKASSKGPQREDVIVKVSVSVGKSCPGSLSAGG